MSPEFRISYIKSRMSLPDSYKRQQIWRHINCLKLDCKHGNQYQQTSIWLPWYLTFFLFIWFFSRIYIWFRILRDVSFKIFENLKCRNYFLEKEIQKVMGLLLNFVIFFWTDIETFITNAINQNFMHRPLPLSSNT